MIAGELNLIKGLFFEVIFTKFSYQKSQKWTTAGKMFIKQMITNWVSRVKTTQNQNKLGKIQVENLSEH